MVNLRCAVVLLLFLFSFFGSFNLVLSEEVVNNLEQGAENIDRLITREDSRNAFLKEEWNKILNNSEFGKFLLSVDALLRQNKEVFGAFLGIDYQVSWLFALTLFFFFYFISTLGNLSLVFLFFIKKDNLLSLFRLVFSILILFFLVISKIPFLISQSLLKAFSNQEDFVARLFYIFILFIVFSFIVFYSKSLRKIAAQQRLRMRIAARDKKLKYLEKKLDQNSSSNNKAPELSENQAYASAYLEEIGKSLRDKK